MTAIVAINERLDSRASDIDIGGGGLGSVAESLLGGATNKNEHASLALMKSRSFLHRFITENDLVDILVPKNENKTRVEKAIQYLIDLRIFLPGLVQDEDYIHWKAYDRFDDLLKVDKNTETGLIEISVDWTDPVLATQWLNKFIDFVNEYTRERASREARKRLGYLNRRLATTVIIDIRNNVLELMKNEEYSLMMAEVSEDYELRLIDTAVPPNRDDVHYPKPFWIFSLAILAGIVIIFSYLLLSSDHYRSR